MLKKLYRWWFGRQLKKVENQMDSLLKAGFALMPEDKKEYDLLEDRMFELREKIR